MDCSLQLLEEDHQVTMRITITLRPIVSLTTVTNSTARRSGSFNYADHRNSLTGRPPIIAAGSGRLSPRAVGSKGRFIIPGGPGLEERKSSK